MKRTLLAVLVATVALGATGLAQALGTRGNPIIWVFPPSTRPTVIQDVATQIVIDIGRATGLYIVPRVMPDYASLIEAFKAAQGNVMGVPTTDQYARIAIETNYQATPRLAAVRQGYSYYFASIYAWRDSGIKTIDDLAGKVWIYNSEGSTSGYVFPNMAFQARGIQFAGVVKSGGHTNSIIALMERQGDFCTGYGSPPTPPANYKGPRWEFGDDPEKWIWDRQNNALYPPELRGEVRDMRYALAGTGLYGDYWDIVQKIGIVDVIGPLPNDCIAFSPGFPEDLQDILVAAILEHIRGEGYPLWSNRNFYEWYDAEEIDDTYYDAYRVLVGLPVPER